MRLCLPICLSGVAVAVCFEGPVWSERESSLITGSALCLQEKQCPLHAICILY